MFFADIPFAKQDVFQGEYRTARRIDFATFRTIIRFSSEISEIDSIPKTPIFLRIIRRGTQIISKLINAVFERLKGISFVPNDLA